MASRSRACKRAPRYLLLLLLIQVSASACGGPSKLPIDLDSEPKGTSRDELRALMARERPIFFEAQDGERFYGEVRSTTGDRFELSKKTPFDGETLVPLSEIMNYRYSEIARAQLAPEEGNSSRGYVLFVTFFVVAILVMGVAYAAAGVPAS